MLVRVEEALREATGLDRTASSARLLPALGLGTASTDTTTDPPDVKPETAADLEVARLFEKFEAEDDRFTAGRYHSLFADRQSLPHVHRYGF